MRWRRILRVLGMALTLMVLWMLVPWLWNGLGETLWRTRDAYISWLDSQPARELPLRPGDRERYPRRGFGLVIESQPDGARIDTFAGRVTRDLINLPDTTIDLALSEAQMDTLYNAVVRGRIFDIRGPHPPVQEGVFMSPDWKVRFLVRAGDSTKELEWNMGESPTEPVADEWKRLRALERMVARMIHAHSAYRSLPPPRGVYLINDVQ